jgi:hypothetical protein
MGMEGHHMHASSTSSQEDQSFTSNHTPDNGKIEMNAGLEKKGAWNIASPCPHSGQQ